MNTFLKYVLTAAVGLVTIVAIPLVASAVTYDKFDRSNSDVVTITNDGGGDIWRYYDQYTQYRLDDKKLRIEGLCASACTFFLKLMPPENVCATEWAQLGFHSIQVGNPYTGYQPALDYNKFFFPMVYPQDILDLFQTSGWDYLKSDVPVEMPAAGLGMLWIPREVLGVQNCE